jgi:hypothetical protein
MGHCGRYDHARELLPYLRRRWLPTPSCKRNDVLVVHLTRSPLADWFSPSAHLHTLAAQDPLPTSPTASSLSSITAATQSPTSQQVLTAQLLVALLEATPQYALPLAKVKEILSARGEKGSAVIGSNASTRVLYGCVAKRLVRIDRGGGEQIVRFDV